ncbi:MAG: SAM-dependent methyltransferase [Thermoleophilia bacterium]|jgi:SAM-dependent methyltransferase|nr:SAM-dependent methyltransferase [Thermoleophilia bacterium]
MDPAPLAEPVQSYAQPAAWYDRIYAGMAKDYAAEAAVIDGIIRARRPGARSLLDVGCGTGLHLEQFAELYEQVAGIDLAPAFVTRARMRCPGAAVTAADMRDFHLGRTFDAVTSLFSAVGHVGDAAGLDAAIAAMAAHVAPGGVLVVEPWVAPGERREGQFGVEISEAPGSTLIRAHHAASDGDVSVIDFAWTEATPAGITRLEETLRITRFSDAQLRAAFERAGLDASFDARGLNDGGRGLWIGLKA